MENGSSSLIVFDLEDLIDLIEREVYKLRGRKSSPGINRWGLGVPTSRGFENYSRINRQGGRRLMLGTNVGFVWPPHIQQWPTMPNKVQQCWHL